MNEKWEDIYSEEQLKRLQKILIENLKVFIKTCEKLNIEYIVYGGTLLGTIKYNGIIPWDDDIDVAMTRENYDRFLKEAPKIIPSDYFIQTPESESQTPYLYTKLRKKGTIFVEEFYNKLNIEKGVYIDIYPIDNVPDNEKLRRKQFNNTRKWIFAYYYRRCIRVKYPIPKNKLKGAILQIALYYLLHLIPRKFILYKLKKNMTKYNNIETNRKACLFSPNYNNIYTNIYPIQIKKFEGIDVCIPNCYDEHLRNRYGDYKRDLPPEKRIGHIPYEIDF